MIFHISFLLRRLWPAAIPDSTCFECACLCRERIAESQALTIEQLIRDKSAVLAEKTAMENAANGSLLISFDNSDVFLPTADTCACCKRTAVSAIRESS
jgi:hypothetical protein